jgi:predicted MFS family arabinose efflux permease
VVVVGQMYSVLPLYPAMGGSFGIAPQAVAITSTAFGLAYAAGFLVAGPLADRYGSRTMITTGLGITAVTTALVATAPTLDVAVVLRVLQGLGAATFAPAAFLYIAHHVRPGRRSVVLSAVTSGMLAAAVVMQVVAQTVSAALNWQAVFLLTAPVLAVLTATATATLLPGERARTTSMTASFRIMPRLLTQPRLLTLYLATVTLLGAFVALYTTISLAGPSGVAGRPGALLALRASALPAMILVPMLAFWLARYAAQFRVVAGLAVAALASLVAAGLGTSTVALAGALLVVVAGLVLAAPAMVEVVGGAAGTNRGTATALYAFAMFTGGSLGGQAVSALVGLGFTGLMHSVAGVLGVGTLLAAVSVRQSHDRQAHST